MATEIKAKEFISELTRVFAANGLGAMLSEGKAKKLLLLTERLITENEKYNLTAITEPSKIILNHYADCAALAARLPKGARIADVGCGAGFPSLPIAILREDVTVVGIDSTAKRIGYVNESARLLELENITAVAMRAEDGAKLPEYREKFDVVTARAVAEMRVLAELCLGYVRVGGRMMAMKGKNAEFELSAAKKAIAMLGGRGTSVEEIRLKGDDEELTHPLIIIEKRERTPDAYPRPYAKIAKKPL